MNLRVIHNVINVIDNLAVDASDMNLRVIHNYKTFLQNGKRMLLI